MSGYLPANREANKPPLPPKAELQWWRQYYFATERGVLGYDNALDTAAAEIAEILRACTARISRASAKSR